MLLMVSHHGHQNISWNCFHSLMLCKAFTSSLISAFPNFHLRSTCTPSWCHFVGVCVLPGRRLCIAQEGHSPFLWWPVFALASVQGTYDFQGIRSHRLSKSALVIELRLVMRNWLPSAAAFHKLICYKFCSSETFCFNLPKCSSWLLVVFFKPNVSLFVISMSSIPGVIKLQTWAALSTKLILYPHKLSLRKEACTGS